MQHWPKKKPLHLRVLCEYFSKADSSTGKLLAELVEKLVQENHIQSCTVISGRRAYRNREAPQLPFESLLGQRLRVYRVPQTNLRAQGMLGRLADDALFALSALLSGLADRQPVVTLVLTNPPILPLAAAVLARLTGKPYVYLIHDLYPDIAIASGLLRKGSLLVRAFQKLQRFMLQRASRVVVVGQCMSEEIQTRYGVQAQSIRVIPNWWSPIFKVIPGSASTASAQSCVQNPERPVVYTYAGNIGSAQDFDTLLNSVSQLHTGLLVEIIGDGEKKRELQQYLEAHPSLPIRMAPYISEAQLAYHFHNVTDVALVTLNPAVSGLAVPSKTYNILAAGLPIIAIMDHRGEIARLISETGCGLVVAPGDCAGLTAAFHAFLNIDFRRQAGQCALEAAKRFNLNLVAHDFAQVLQEVMVR